MTADQIAEMFFDRIAARPPQRLGAADLAADQWGTMLTVKQAAWLRRTYASEVSRCSHSDGGSGTFKRADRLYNWSCYIFPNGAGNFTVKTYVGR